MDNVIGKRLTLGFRFVTALLSHFSIPKRREQTSDQSMAGRCAAVAE